MKRAQEWLSENDGVVLWSRKTESHKLIEKIQSDAKAPNWIDINSQIPSNNIAVLIATKDGIVVVAERIELDKNVTSPFTFSMKQHQRGWAWKCPDVIAGRDEGPWFGFDDLHVTHWMHLPNPPK